jgi:hypothetical protein
MVIETVYLSGSQPFLTWGTLETQKVLAEHFRSKKTLTEHLSPKILQFCMNVKISKNLVIYLTLACRTLVF